MNFSRTRNIHPPKFCFPKLRRVNLSPIKQIELLASNIPDVVSLAQGIPSFDTPAVVKKAAIRALNRGAVAKYSLTYGLPELCETIEQKLAEDGMYYDFEKEIIVTVGSIEAITATLISIIDSRKNEIILFSPSYTSYPEAVKVAGGKPVFVNLIEGIEADRRGFKRNLEADSRGSSGWRIDFKCLKRKINSRTAAILFCNPNNPTGTIFPKEDLLKIAELAAKRNIFILSDEVYKDFIYSDSISETSDVPRGSTPQILTDNLQEVEPPKIKKNNSLISGSPTSVSEIPRESAFSPRKSAFFSLAQIPELRKIVVRIFSLSKAYAMTGWRIGFLHSDEENIKEIVKVHDSLVTCAPVISQYAALSALDFGDENIKKFRDEFQKRRDLICRHLDELQRYFSFQKPDGAYFVFPEILAPAYKILQAKNSWDFALKLLERVKVAVVPGFAFGPNGEHHLRVSFSRSEKDINEAMKRLKEYFL